MIKAIAKLIVALNGNVKKSQIAAGFAWGLLLALIPAGNAFWIVLLLVSFFFKHNHGSMLLGLAVLKLLLPLAASPIDTLGWEILHIDRLQPLLTTMYNMPFVPFTKFNNTLVAGGLVSGIILWLPAFFLFKFLVSLYRNTLSPKIRNSKIIKKIAKFPFISAISKAVAKSIGKGA
ncbi:MAG: TIGR03546 family protein [Treponema sp.]|jgi:uncharacterized protein (TIGR03546 family)|nr:TIGR03546 family protein [Treponema sp.]